MRNTYTYHLQEGSFYCDSQFWSVVGWFQSRKKLAERCGRNCSAHGSQKVEGKVRSQEGR